MTTDPNATLWHSVNQGHLSIVKHAITSLLGVKAAQKLSSG